MAITYPLLTGWFDSFASSSTRSKDLGTGSYRTLVVLTGNTDGATSVTGVTVDGNAMAAANALYTDGSGRDWRAFVYDVSSLTGSKNIVASYSGTPSTGGAYVAAMVIKGGSTLTVANFTTCLDSNTDGGGGSDPSRTVTTTSGDTAVILAIDITGATPGSLSGSTLITSDSGTADAAYKVASGSSTAVGMNYGAFVETVTTGFSITEAPSTPTLTSPTALATGKDSATAGATTDTAVGTMYFRARIGGSAASSATIIAEGTGLSISSTGAKTQSMTSLSTGSTYVFDIVQDTDGAGSNPSNVVTTGSATPTTLSIAATALSSQSGVSGSTLSWTGVTPESLITGVGIGARTWAATSGVGASGLSANSSTGVLGGTLGSAGSYTITLTNTDSSTAGSEIPQTETKTVSVTISASGGSATSVTLAGPSSGTVGVASSNFTVGANGTISGSVVVTPSDSSGGGSFSPSTVTISAASPTGTFTYTAGSAGTKSISVTNNGGISNPSALSYVASEVGSYSATFGPAYFSTGSGPQVSKAATWTVFMAAEPGSLTTTTGIDQSGTSDSTGVWTATGLPQAGAGIVIAKDEDGGVYYKNITAA